MQKITLADYFGVNPGDYKGINVVVLDLPVRISNRFYRFGIENIEELLLVGWDDIDAWPGFGKGCKETLENKLVDFFGFGKRMVVVPSNVSDDVKKAFSKYEMVDIDTRFLSISQRSTVEKYNQAISSLDRKDVELFLGNLDYCNILIDSLQNISVMFKAKKFAADLLTYIPDHVKSMPVQKVLLMYSDNYAFVHDLVDEDNTDSFERVLKEKCAEWLYNKSFEYFCKWIKTNLTTLLDNLLIDSKMTEKKIEILNERANGYTLEQVGTKLGVTRERIRQIEVNAMRIISLWDEKNKVSKILKLRYCDTGYISTQGIIDIFGRYGKIICQYLKSFDNKMIRFEKDYDGFVVCDETLLCDMQRYVDNLPDVIHINDSLSLDNGKYPPELLMREILAQYKITGDVYHRSRLTMTSIYSDVLKNEYPSGIHVYDDKDLNSFRKKVEEKYGDIKISSTNRALGVRLSDVGILCGRGIYKSKQTEYISQELTDKIYDYLVKSELPALLTNTVYAEFEDELVKQGIDNKYYLQGIIREIFGNKFIFRRDYIIKDANFTNISSALIDYVSKSNIPVTKREIYDKFPGITEIVVNLAMADSRILNLFGSYLATSHIEISDDEIEYLKELVVKYTASGKSIHFKDIYNEVSRDNKMLLTRNFIVQPFGIYGLLEYLFPDEFNFDRPYIARKDVEIEKTIDSLYSRVSESDIVEIEELSAIAKERHFQINSLVVFANSCNDTHLLISNHQMASLEFLGIDDSVARQVEDVVASNILETIPVSKLTCIHLFPKISIQWNEWIIYSLINKYSSLLEVGLSSNQLKQAIPFVALKGSFDSNAMCNALSITQSSVSIADDMDNIDELIEGLIDDEIIF